MVLENDRYHIDSYCVKLSKVFQNRVTLHSSRKTAVPIHDLREESTGNHGFSYEMSNPLFET